MSSNKTNKSGNKKWLNADANKTRQAMIKQYGYETGNTVFYAKAEKEYTGPRTKNMSQKANTVYAKHAKRNT